MINYKVIKEGLRGRNITLHCPVCGCVDYMYVGGDIKSGRSRCTACSTIYIWDDDSLQKGKRTDYRDVTGESCGI